MAEATNGVPPLNKREVREFFDSCAPSWDAEMIKDDRIINIILDNASVSTGKNILDVACGTGVLIPYYFARRPASVTAADISPEMCRICSDKFSDRGVSVICCDAETYDFPKQYDAIVIYNAFPHFPDPEGLIKRLSGALVSGGMLTVAHGMSRDRINSHHSGTAHRVSVGLMTVKELADLFRKYLDLKLALSNDMMYQVVGRKK
ncbi:MAG: methyltransferase domain-containing protein [Clostridia bacterium]|nr:methyltransferase domain-containing protein [Clostridia bacterium]